jgi:twitching motility protein PilT
MALNLKALAKALVKYEGSDLHLKAGRSPILRIHGELAAANLEPLSLDEVAGMIFDVLSDRHREILERERHVDLSLQFGSMGRFRMNAYYERGHLSAVLRRVPTVIPQLNELGVPAAVGQVVGLSQGLVLVTGATGSGKSTTLAALIHEMNRTRALHILTLEDPIEFMHSDQSSTLSQREIGTDVLSFEEGLISGLRQDPDVIVMGELRDATTMRAALNAAETGHLVLATLHTMSAKGSLERLIDSFASESRSQVRMQLASTLQAIFCQKLISKSSGAPGRVCAMEILFKSPSIEQQILNGELDKIPGTLQSSKKLYQMQTFNQALLDLVARGVITQEEALKNTVNPDELKLEFAGIVRDQK